LGTVPIMRHKVLAAAEAAGREVDDVTCAVNLQIALDHHDPSSPEVITGTSDTVAARLLELVAVGFTAFNFIPVGPQLAEQTERLAIEVIPAVRAMA
jgi:alkanesulfonate monooxygenase SsuD/methylene tetrahydromethanopterin reductase-like flavin-dependent oxidoreductase (luciferase family)